MNLIKKEIKVREIVNGYVDNGFENGVVGYGGLLNITHKYNNEWDAFLRECAVFYTRVNRIKHTSVFYFYQNNDGTFELIDGYFRMKKICDYITGNFAEGNLDSYILKFDYDCGMFYRWREREEREVFLDSKLKVFIIEATEEEKNEYINKFVYTSEEAKESFNIYVNNNNKK